MTVKDGYERNDAADGRALAWQETPEPAEPENEEGWRDDTGPRGHFCVPPCRFERELEALKRELVAERTKRSEVEEMLREIQERE